MIDIFINGERKTVDENSSMAAVLIASGYHCERIAVAINSEFIARADYVTRFLKTDDSVDVVVPIGGG
jgi:sulfur carrier protein